MRHVLPLLPLLPIFLVAAACDTDFNVITGGGSPATPDGGVVATPGDSSGPIVLDSISPLKPDSGPTVSVNACTEPSAELELAAKPYPVECDGLPCWVNYDAAGAQRVLFAEPDDVVPVGYYLRPLGATASRAYFEAYSGTEPKASLLVSASLTGTRDQHVERAIGLQLGDHLVAVGNASRMYFLVTSEFKGAVLYRSILGAPASPGAGDTTGDYVQNFGDALTMMSPGNVRLSLLPSGLIHPGDDLYVANEVPGGQSFFGVDHLTGEITDYVYPDTGLAGFVVSGTDSNHATLTAFETSVSSNRLMKVLALSPLGGRVGSTTLKTNYVDGASVRYTSISQNRAYSAASESPTVTLINNGTQLVRLNASTGSANGATTPIYTSANVDLNTYPALSDVWFDNGAVSDPAHAYVLETCPGSNPVVPAYELRYIDTTTGAATWISSRPGPQAIDARLKAWYGNAKSTVTMPTATGSVVYRRTP